MTRVRYKFSDETLKFRALSRDAKFASLIALCKTLGHFPHPYTSKKHTPDDYERVRAQFYVNMMSKKVRNELNDHDLANLAKVDKFRPKRLTIEQKIDLVYQFVSLHGHLPNAEDSDDISDALRSIRTGDPETLSIEHKKKMDAILHIGSTIKKTLTERLVEILAFCESRERTPKQHTLDRSEKHLADSLSSIKQRIKISSMIESDKKLFTDIMTFAPKARKATR